MKWAVIGAALLGGLFGRSISFLTNISLFERADEAGLALLVVAAFIANTRNRRRWRGIPGLGYLLVFAAFLLASSLLRHVEPYVFIPSIALTFKGVVLAVCVAQFDFSEKDISVWRRIIIALSICCSLGMAINLVLGQTWNSLFGKTLDNRFGLPGITGLFPGQGDAALLAAALAGWGVAAAAIFGRRATVRDRRWAIATALGTVLTGRRAPVAGLVLSIVLLYVRRRRVEGMYIAIVIGLAMIIVLGGYFSTLASVTFDDYVTNGNRQARTIMTRDTFSIASQYFPFGAGGGRFGSYMAQVHYSPEYISRGYHTVWGMMLPPGNGNFLSDTQWPAVIAEAGYIGAAFAIIGLFKCFVFALRSSSDNDPALSYMGTGLIMQFVILTTASVGAVVYFGGSAASTFFYIALGIAVALKRGLAGSSEEERVVGSVSARTR